MCFSRETQVDISNVIDRSDRGGLPWAHNLLGEAQVVVVVVVVFKLLERRSNDFIQGCVYILLAVDVTISE